MIAHNATHDLGLGIKVSGNNTISQIYETLGEGVALLLMEKNRAGKVEFYYRPDEGGPATRLVIQLAEINQRNHTLVLTAVEE